MSFILKDVETIVTRIDPAEFHVSLDFSPEGLYDVNKVFYFDLKEGNSPSSVIESLSLFITELLMKTGG